MDHSNHQPSGEHGAGHGEGCPMMGHGSTFTMSTSATLLFKGVQVGPDLITYLFACVFIVGLGLLRQELVRLSEQDSNSAEKRSLFFFAQATISYSLMLVAMTFNVGLFLAVIIGLTAGFYRSLLQLKNKSECCA